MVVELLVALVLGIGIGIFTGLLPALPVYTGPFLLYQFHTSMGIEALLVFWLSVYVGSQFFGSIACITTGIPGEESSLVYIKDIQKYTLSERNSLLYTTAVGSAVAGLLATMLAWIILTLGNNLDIGWLFGLKVQLVLFTLILASFVFISERKWVTLALIAFGVSIAPQSNYALPPTWYDFQYLFQGYTFYMVILGTMIIPTLFSYTVQLTDKLEEYTVTHERLNWTTIIKSSWLGFFAGLVPGPSASVGSILAYRSTKDPEQKIIAAETANNSAVIASTIPFFLLALPINQNTIIMSGVMDINGDLITEVIHEASLWGLNSLDWAFSLLLVAISIYYVLSTRLINIYVQLIVLLHKRIRLILVAIILSLIYLDMQTAEVTVAGYFLLLSFFTLVGYVIKKLRTSPVPMMFAILLGNKLVWSIIQVKEIYL